MNIIETLNPPAFTEYLKRYNNTICGRHPIGVMLQVIFYHDIIIIFILLYTKFNKNILILLVGEGIGS